MCCMIVQRIEIIHTDWNNPILSDLGVVLSLSSLSAHIWSAIPCDDDLVTLRLIPWLLSFCSKMYLNQSLEIIQVLWAPYTKKYARRLFFDSMYALILGTCHSIKSRHCLRECLMGSPWNNCKGQYDGVWYYDVSRFSNLCHRCVQDLGLYICNYARLAL